MSRYGGAIWENTRMAKSSVYLEFITYLILLTLLSYYTIIVRGQNNDFKDKVAKYNVLGVEMESFALFTNAKLLNKKSATLLMVSDSFIYPDKLSSLEREQGLDNLITLALETSLKL